MMHVLLAIDKNMDIPPIVADAFLDARGLRCPEPIMLLHQKIFSLSAHQILELLATDPSTERDIKNFCHYLGHTLLRIDYQEAHYRYYIRKY